MLRFLTAGESHGKGLVVVLEGMPAGLHLQLDAITEQVRRDDGSLKRIVGGNDLDGVKAEGDSVFRHSVVPLKGS